jgi:hypothetical protein
MELMGYDASDWKLNPDPSIDPAIASEYMQRLSLDGRPTGWKALTAGIGRLGASAAAALGRRRL